MVVPTLVGQALSGRDLTVFGDGTQTRCFTHVSDVVRALMQLAVHTASPGHVFNVGSDQETSILTLAERVLALTGSRSHIVLVPYREAYQQGFEDMMRRVPDLTRVRKLIGYVPTVSLDGILRSVIEHQRSRLQPEVYAENGLVEPAFEGATACVAGPWEVS
jgi:UDP-glucose 4-epimerase